MSRYVINVLANQDLNEIADYFDENSLEAGERFFRAFNRKCQQLVAFPDSSKSYAAFALDSDDCFWMVTSSFIEFWMMASKF